ncbi:MAG: lipopolysaccharide biosynthesis protein [Candidatus Cloacimonetes bacterium]|nr:lipopolysaccharide biosynthesis protein [Candidatus Cloacimonadota bacterium]
MNLKQKTVSGLKWSFTDSIMNQVVHFVFGIVLARLLSPSEYGIVGMSMVFVTLLEVLAEGGLMSALVRKKECTEQDYNTMFYTNIVIGAVLFLLLFFSSEAIAAFYKKQELILLVKVMSLNLVFNSFGMVETAMLTRSIDFKRQTRINFLSSISSGIIGVIFAYMGFGFWSLAIKTLWQNLSRVVLLHLSSTWKPKLMYSWESFRELFGFGSKMLLSSIIHSIYKNIYSLVIGKYYSAEQLGYYSRANQFKSYITGSIESSTQRVTYPVLASINEDNHKLKDAYVKLLKLVFFITATLLGMLFVNAKEVVLLLVGEKWAPSIVYLQILCFGGVLYPLQLINLNVIKAKGRSDLYLFIEILEKIFSIPAIVLGVIYGMNALVWGVVFNSIVTYIANSMFSGKMINYSIFKQVIQLSPVFINTLIMTLVALAAGSILSKNLFISLIIKCLTCFIYIIVSGELFKIKEYFEIKKLAYDQFVYHIGKKP